MDIPKINNVFSFNVCQRLITTYLDISGVFRQSHYGTMYLEDFTYAHLGLCNVDHVTLSVWTAAHVTSFMF